ncbi:MAG: hypothetical protein ACI9U2_001114 [Bradymonadia bacterium]|jgi:hypothetical protein
MVLIGVALLLILLFKGSFGDSTAGFMDHLSHDPDLELPQSATERAAGSVGVDGVVPKSALPLSGLPKSVAPITAATASAAPASVAPASVAPASVEPASTAPASTAPALRTPARAASPSGARTP